MTQAKIFRTVLQRAGILLSVGVFPTIGYSQFQTGNGDGSIRLPSGPPPTRSQGPLPEPLLKTPVAEKAFARSLSPSQLDQLIKGRTLSIRDAVAIALAANRDLAAAISSLQLARGRSNEAKSMLIPQASLSGDITEYDQNTSINFFNTSILQINQFNPVYTGQVTLPLDLFGSIHQAISQAQFNEIAARVDINRTRNSIVFNVRSAFYQALRAQAQYGVAVENLTNAQVRFSDANKGLSAGIASRFDLLTAQRDVADAQQGVVNAEGQVSLALGQLKSVIGLDISTPLRITDADAVEIPPGITPVVLPTNENASPNLVLSPDTSQPPSPSVPAAMAPKVDVHSVGDLVKFGPEYDAVVSEALRTRPEILEAEAQISAAKKGVQYANRTMRPSVSLQLQYIYQPDATIFVRAHQELIGLMVTVPLYDGGQSAALTQQAKAEVSSAQTAHRNAIDQVTLDVQAAYITLNQARDRVQVTEAEVAQAKEAFRLAQVRAKAGLTQNPTVSPQLELINAQTGLTEAESNRLNAIYDYNVARSQIDRAVGRYSYSSGPGYPKAPKIGG